MNSHGPRRKGPSDKAPSVGSMNTISSILAGRLTARDVIPDHVGAMYVRDLMTIGSIIHPTDALRD